MSFDSAAFAVFCCLAVVVLNVVRGGISRVGAVVVINALFVASFVSSVVELVPLAAFVVVGYLAVLLAAHVGSKGMLALVVGVIGLFIWLKKYTVVSFLSPLPFAYLIVGMSYVLFRIVHLIVDVSQQALRVPGPLRYLAYVLFFLSFVSGPIQRFEDFAGQLAEPRLPRSAEDSLGAVNRIIRGVFLVAAVTPMTSAVFSHFEHAFYDALKNDRLGLEVANYTIAAATYMIHLYLNFSGYMDMVIGIGGLCGFRLPENFDRPYLSKNILDFWSRWHITLSEWFKFYVFNPTLKSLSERWHTPATMPYLGAASFFVTFLAMGIWHGSTTIYVLYGLFLGFGTAANKVYQINIVKRLGKQGYRRLCERQWYAALARAFALAYISTAITCTWLAPPAATAFMTWLGVVLIVSAVLALSAIIFLADIAASEAAAAASRQPVFSAASRFLTGSSSGAWPMWAALRFCIVIQVAAIANVIVAVTSGSVSAVEFVYGAF